MTETHNVSINIMSMKMTVFIVRRIFVTEHRQCIVIWTETSFGNFLRTVCSSANKSL